MMTLEKFCLVKKSYKKNKITIISCFKKLKLIFSKYYPNKQKIPIKIVARLDRYKDQSTLIKAIPEILKMRIKVNLSLIGDGSKRKDLERISKSIGVSKLVNFMGSRRDIPKILLELDIFVFSARENEGFGIAMADSYLDFLKL